MKYSAAEKTNEKGSYFVTFSLNDNNIRRCEILNGVKYLSIVLNSYINKSGSLLKFRNNFSTYIFYEMYTRTP